MRSPMRIDEAVQRLRGVFLEIPGTQLSLTEAAVMSGLDRSVCESVLQALEDAKVLRRGRNGRYQHNDSTR